MAPVALFVEYCTNFAASSCFYIANYYTYSLLPAEVLANPKGFYTPLEATCCMLLLPSSIPLTTILGMYTSVQLILAGSLVTPMLPMGQCLIVQPLSW